MNWDEVTADLIREVRGARTQKALSRVLGFRSNVLFSWEHGRDAPTLLRFVALLSRVGRSPEDWLRDFGRGQPPTKVEDRQELAAYLQSLKGGRTIQDISSSLGESRYVLGRWLTGKTDIPLSRFFSYVEETTLSALDLVALLVDPRRLPSASAAFERLEAARRSAIEQPWSHAIVHMVQLASYRALPRHEPGWFASRLGISEREEAECLELLVALGRLSFDGCRYASTETLAVDTRPDPDATRQLASFWMQEGAKRVLSPGTGRYAFNTFGISRADLRRLENLQRRYFSELRSIVNESSSTEAVAVATFQLFQLVREPDSGG